MSEPTKDWRRKYLKEALNRLYARDFHLVQKSKERAATASLACHLRDVLKEARYLKAFPEIRVDVEYGREGDDTKRSLRGTPVVPDLIVHVPGECGPNVVAIEVKGYWNLSGQQADKRKLADYQAKQGYRFVYFVVLDRNVATIESL